MSIVIKTGYLQAKDENGEYIVNNTVAEKTTAEQIEEIEAAGSSQIAAVQQKGVETRASIPNDYTELSDSIEDLKAAFYDNATVEPNWTATNGYIKYEDGGVTLSSNWKRTEFVAIPSDSTGLYITCPVVTDELQSQIVSAISFYTSNTADSFIEGSSKHVILGETQGLKEVYVSVPDTAKYIRVSVLASFVEEYSIKAVSRNYVVVNNSTELLQTKENYVLVLSNDYQYGDYGPCWFKHTDGWNANGIERSDGSYVYPLPDQGPIVASNAPYQNVMNAIKTYVGNANLVYGNANTLYNETCTNEIDCSTFAMAVMQGITYENSRYVLGSDAANITADHIGDTVIIGGAARPLASVMAVYYAMHKRLYRLPSTSSLKAVNLLKFGDLLFSHLDGYNDNKYYGIGHVAIVLSTMPKIGAIVVAQGGGGGTVNNESTAVKTSVRILTAEDFESNYPVFARPDYGEDITVNDFLRLSLQMATPGTFKICPDTGIRMYLDSIINSEGRQVFNRYTCTTDFIAVPSSGSIIYDGEMTGLDANQTPYVSWVCRYDEDKKYIDSNGILTPNNPVAQQITKAGQSKETKYIRISFGHTESQQVTTMLADTYRFSASLTV